MNTDVHCDIKQHKTQTVMANTHNNTIVFDADGRKMTQTAMLVECIELCVQNGYDITPFVGLTKRSINFEFVAEMIHELRETED